MLIDQDKINDIYTAFSTRFNQVRSTVEPTWNRVATEVPSNSKENHYGWLGQFPGLREWVGDRVIKQMRVYDYRIKNRKFEGTVEVDWDDVDDDNVGIYSPLVDEQANAVETFPDELVYSLLGNGFTELCYDGQPFFDADHPVGPKGKEVSVSNVQAGAEAPWFLLNTRRTLKPLIFQKRRDFSLDVISSHETIKQTGKLVFGSDGRCNAGFGFWQMAFGSKAVLSEANFDAAYDAMASFKSDEGRPLGNMPNLLVYGPSNRKKADEIIKRSRKANGEDNTNQGLVEGLLVPWLQ